jgi:hypothetical protein
MRVDQATLGVHRAGLGADGGEGRVVEFPRPLDVVAADGDVAEHAVFFSPGFLAVDPAGREGSTDRRRWEAGGRLLGGAA